MAQHIVRRGRGHRRRYEYRRNRSPCRHAGGTKRYGNPRTTVTCYGNEPCKPLYENHVRTDNRYPLRQNDWDIRLLFRFPYPFATMTNREWGQIGNNYLKGLFALGFQGFLIMICVGIYAVLVGEMVLADNLHSAIFPLQPIPLSSVSPCSNPAHWQNPYSTPTKGRKEVFSGVCTCTQRPSKVKTKVAFNLTKRQILCFSVALIGLPLFFCSKTAQGRALRQW